MQPDTPKTPKKISAEILALCPHQDLTQAEVDVIFATTKQIVRAAMEQAWRDGFEKGWQNEENSRYANEVGHSFRPDSSPYRALPSPDECHSE